MVFMSKVRVLTGYLYFRIVVIHILITTTFLYAGEIDSARDLSDELINFKKGRVSQENISILGMSIGKHTLDDVRSKFGDVKTTHVREHADDELCYSATIKDEKTYLIFGSGAMGGWKDITTFQVLSKTSDELTCMTSSKVSRQIATLGGIKLGLSLKDLNKILGAPSQIGKDFVVYSFEQPSDTPEFTMSSGVQATLKHNYVTSFTVFLIESN